MCKHLCTFIYSICFFTFIALQFYSDKTLLTHKGLTAHPIRATLLNLMFGMRIKNLKDVGYIPELDRPPTITDALWRQVKLAFINKCLASLLEPLRLASFSGVALTDSLQRQHNVFPRLFSYVVDDPESKDITCIKGGSTKFPCELCMVDHDSLHDIPAALGNKFKLRTEALQKEHYAKICAASSNAEHDRLSRDLSTHPIPSCLWNWADQLQGYGTSTWAVAYEAMHNEEEETLQRSWVCLRQWLKSLRSSS